MKRRKLSNKAKGKILILSAILVPTAILLAVFLSRLDFDYFRNEFLKKTIDNAVENGLHIVALSVIVCPVILLSMIAIINHVIPVLCFFIGKPLKYFTIWRLCLKNRYACHFHRAPWLSLRGVEERADVEIQMDEKTLHVHFIDIPSPISKMFLLFNDREYRIHKTIVGKIKRDGVVRGPNMSGQKVGIMRSAAIEMDEANYDAYVIPKFPPKGTQYHYLVIDPSYADAYFISDKKMLTVSGECTVGNLTVCKWKILKKRLKHELHAHFESLGRKEDY